MAPKVPGTFGATRIVRARPAEAYENVHDQLTRMKPAANVLETAFTPTMFRAGMFTVPGKVQLFAGPMMVQVIGVSTRSASR